MSDTFEQLDIIEQLQNDFEFFVNFVHKRITGEEFEWLGYNKKIKTELMNVYKLQYLLLFINIPPRLGKTTLLTYFIAWTMFKSGRTYNNYYTYSDLLVNRMYSTITKIFKIPEISEHVESTYKREKEDFSNSSGGGLFAQTTLGQVTGFGAGRKDDMDNFNGCIVIDDPHKAQDSIVRIASANSAIKSAVLNRKNNHRVPIIVIMQRLHKFDATGYLMDLYSDYFVDGRAKQLKLSAEINGKPIAHKEYPLEMLALEKEKDPSYYWSQLMQEPQNVDGKYFKNQHFETYESIAKDRSSAIISFNPENTAEPIVLVAFKKKDKDAVILDYRENIIEADSFFESVHEFCEQNNSKKVYIPSSLITKTVRQELKPLKVEELEESTNVGLSAFYAVGLLKGGKIKLKDDELYEAFKEELKLYPNSKRDFATKAMINVLEVLFVKGGSTIKSSL